METEASFRPTVDGLLRRLLRQLDAIDPDGEKMDVRISDGVLQVDFEGGGTFVLSQQVPVRELWLSAERRAWHFSAPGWAERDTGEALSAVLEGLFSRRLGSPVRFTVD